MPSISRRGPPGSKPSQLAFDFAVHRTPYIVQAHGLAETHPFPLVSRGRPFRDRRRVPVDTAWRRYPELQLDSATAQVAVVLDVDRNPQACLDVAFGSAVRPPNWICTSPRGYSHVVYLLASPVLMTENARKRPLTYLARIAEYYTDAYGADTGYSGVLTHNPVHPRYAHSTTWWREGAWRLAELAETIPTGWRLPARPKTVEGRNCTLFRAAMRWFGMPRHWNASRDPAAVHAWIAAEFRRLFPPPQPGWHPRECWWIAQSVSRYCRENLDSGRTQAGFLRQRIERGRKSGAKRRQGTPLEFDRAPWLAFGISRRTWYRHQGMPPPTLSDLRPWEIEGISRTTWYDRRQREAR